MNRWKILCGMLFLVWTCKAQLNTEKVMANARNALYFEDYVLSIQYFSRVIRTKPYLAEPYFFRAIAKLNLEDYTGAEEDCSLALERNPYIVDAYACRGIAKQNTNRFEEAVEDYKKGMRYSPENKLFLVNTAVCLTANKRYTAAEEAYNNLLEIYPSYAMGYVGRALLYLEKRDTLLAERDVEKSISLSKYEPQAFAMRAYLRTLRGEYNLALKDIEQAIKLQPSRSNYLLNRAIIRYYLNNLKGAMSDYNRILSIEPQNTQALYNRGLLRTQVGDKNRALEDFSAVLAYEPDNDFARYNRALLYGELGNYRESIQDLSKVLKKYPEFAPAYLLRSEMKKRINDIAGSEKDYWTAFDLQEKYRKEKKEGKNTTKNDSKTRDKEDKNINKFDRLLRSEPEKTSTKTTYKSETRGRVQNKPVMAGLQELFVFTYYELSERINEHVLYLSSVSSLNRKRLLPRELKITNTSVALSETQIDRHFKSIEQLSTKLKRKEGEEQWIRFARSIDFMLVQDYTSAISDLDTCLMLNTQFELAYFNRAVLRYHQMESEHASENHKIEYALPSSSSLPSSLLGQKNLVNKKEYKIILLKVKEDLENVLRLNPKNFLAYYNKGNVLCALSAYTNAIEEYSKALDIESDFAEAYYNRGLVYIYLGKNEEGIADLSKAGELGIVEAYNLIKRLTD